jgi:hypothetical protein
MNEGYSICFNEWALDKEIKNELGLLLIISSLCAEKGFCFASNKYFAELFDQPEETISRKLRILETKNYIRIEYKKRGCEVISREIRLTKMLTDDKQKCEPTINKNVKENNISNNNTSKNIYKEAKKSFGSFKRVKLTEAEYKKLVEEFGEQFIKEQIEKLDEYVETNNNKNKYSNFNLVLRKSIRENWFKVKNVPEWFNKEIEKEAVSQEDEEYMKSLLKGF